LFAYPNDGASPPLDQIFPTKQQQHCPEPEASYLTTGYENCCLGSTAWTVKPWWESVVENAQFWLPQTCALLLHRI